MISKKKKKSEISDLRSEISETLIVRSSASFRRHPVDDLVRIHDVARLAMDAVGEIDLQPPLPISAFVHHLINSCGTKSLAGIAILFRATRRTNIGVQDVQMARLILAVAHSRVVNVSDFVKGNFSIKLQTVVSLSKIVPTIAIR